MNERIRKLAKKSGFGTDSTGIYTAKLEHLPITENMEKFAELIIRECAKIADDGFGSAHFGLGINGQMLKEHFGVEE
jgi:hypothetical protein